MDSRKTRNRTLIKRQLRTGCLFLIVILALLCVVQFSAKSAQAESISASESVQNEAAGTSEAAQAEPTYHDSDPDDYITKRFDVSVTTDRNHVFHVREEIDVEFIQPHHGITRYIPEHSRLYQIRRIRVRGGKKEVSSEFEIDSDGCLQGDRMIRIGDADKYLTGPQSYVITYDLVCNEDDDPEQDFLSLDLLPTGWDTSIREADLTLALPEGIDMSGLELYAGRNNSKTNLLGEKTEEAEDQASSEEADSEEAEDQASSEEADSEEAEDQASSEEAEGEVYEGEEAYEEYEEDTFFQEETLTREQVSVEWNESGDQLHIHVTDNPMWSGLTIRAALPEGYWSGARTRSWLVGVFAGVMAAIAAAVLLLRARVGRRPQIIQTVEFEPPEGMTPAEIGYVVDGHVDKGDMSSMLMYFADRGYLSIREVKKDKYEAVMERGIDAKEKSFARTLFSGMFSGSKREQAEKASVALDKMPANYGTSVQAAEASLNNHYTGKKRLYTKASETGRALSVALCIAAVTLPLLLGALCCWRYAMIILVVPAALLVGFGMALVQGAADRSVSQNKVKGFGRGLFGILLMIGGTAISAVNAGRFFAEGNPGLARYLMPGGDQGKFVVHLLWPMLLVAGVVFLVAVLAMRMRRRTDWSASMLGKIMGFREFIRTAEIDRLRVLQNEDPSYFFRIMPYAYVMGLSTHWAKKFTDLHVTKPDWYTSANPRGFVFSPLWYSRMTTTAARSYSGGFTNLPDSGSHGGFSGGGGGFSGGGFSGGGFGGGGGGAW